MSTNSTPQRRIARLSISTVAYGVFLVIAFLLPQFVRDNFVLRLMSQVWFYVLLTLGQNVITGFTGMLSLGQAAYYGIGAYTSALLALQLGAPSWPLAFLAAGVVACVFGILLGFPCVRLGSDYLTLMTVGFSEITSRIFLNWMEVTNGPMGLRGIRPPQIGTFVFNTPERYYYLYLLIALLGYVGVRQVVNSKFGRALIAIREDEIAAAAMGINITYHKLLAFGIGAFLAGISGSMLAHFILFVGPTSFSVDESILHMQMAILGGLGSLPGSILGAAVLTIVPQALQSIWEYRMLLNGILMVVLMVWRPEGILGTAAAGAAARERFRQLLAPIFGGKNREYGA